MARRLIFLALVAALATAGPTSFADLGRVVAQDQRSLAPFVPTPQDVVDRMLELADLTSDDIVYDLWCGWSDRHHRRPTVRRAWCRCRHRSPAHRRLERQRRAGGHPASRPIHRTGRDDRRCI